MAQRVKMPDNDTWPPKPALPDPLTEYDDVVAAKLAALSGTKTGPNKLLLIKALRDEEGIELRQAYAVVNNYWARHTDLARTQAVPRLAWLGCLLPFSTLGLAVFNLCLQFRREAILRLPHHHAAFLAFCSQERIVLYALLALILLMRLS